MSFDPDLGKPFEESDQESAALASLSELAAQEAEIATGEAGAGEICCCDHFAFEHNPVDARGYSKCTKCICARYNKYPGHHKVLS